MSREQILERVRAALADVPRSTPEADVPVAWEYSRPTPVDDLLGRFVERVEDYKAVVERCAADEVGARVTAALQRHGVSEEFLVGLACGFAVDHLAERGDPLPGCCPIERLVADDLRQDGRRRHRD